MQHPLPLAFREGGQPGLDNFVVAGNEIALNQVRALAMGEAREWIYLFGPAGVGKTHLLLAACRKARESGFDARYLSLSQLGQAGTDPFQATEQAQFVALDGIDAIQGQRFLEVALFHAWNRMRAAETRLLICGSVPLAGLAIGLPDLHSRLGQCMQFGLKLLDETGLRSALRARALARGLQVSEPVWDYLLRHGPRDLGAQLVLLERLDRESLARKRGISVPLARELLATDGLQGPAGAP